MYTDGFIIYECRMKKDDSNGSSVAQRVYASLQEGLFIAQSCFWVSGSMSFVLGCEKSNESRFKHY